MDLSARAWHATSGLLATAAGMAAGHLTAALLNPPSSPVLAVSSTVIDLTPTPLKEWAVRELGEADKPVLLGSVVAGTLVLAAIAGLLARRSFGLAAGILLALVGLAMAAALSRPVTEPVDVLPGIVTGVAGVSALWWLTHWPHRYAVQAAATEAEVPGTTRRAVLIAGGTTAAAAAVLAATGQWVIRARSKIAQLLLPAPADPAGPFPTGIEADYRGISPFRTPIPDFYRVDTNLTLPLIDLDDWQLVIDGDVDQRLSFTIDELLEMPLVERDITLTCVSNEVGGKYVGAARWLGVRLTDLLDMAGVGTKADQILSTAVDGFTISTPLDVARDGRDALVAVGMNGTQLPLEHGFPARLLVPGLYGFVGATKWLTRLTLTTYAQDEAYWTERGWATDAPIKPSSRIDTPAPLSTIDAGRTVIGGVAWAQHRGVGRVEVRIDGGAWQPARLGPDAGVDYWRQWYLPWQATPGRHMLAVRTVTEDGEEQTPVRTSPFPEGSSGIQEVVVTVR